MTMKYLSVLNAVMDETAPFKNEYGQMIGSFYAKFHMPVDRYIMKAISAKKNTTYGLGLSIIPLEHEKPVDVVEIGSYCESGKNKSKPWSKWDSEDYKKFRKGIENIKFYENEDCELDWEGNAWIEQAKKILSYKERYLK